MSEQPDTFAAARQKKWRENYAKSEKGRAANREHQRQYRLLNREKINEAERLRRHKTGAGAKGKAKWRQRYPEKQLAHHIVERSIRRGLLVRPDRCSECNKICKPEAHHENYAEPLNIVWLCRACHLRRDGRQQRVVPQTAVSRDRKTHCKHGHAFTPENTRIVCRQQRCMTCKRLNDQRMRQRRNADKLTALLGEEPK